MAVVVESECFINSGCTLGSNITFLSLLNEMSFSPYPYLRNGALDD